MSPGLGCIFGIFEATVLRGLRVDFDGFCGRQSMGESAGLGDGNESERDRVREREREREREIPDFQKRERTRCVLVA